MLAVKFDVDNVSSDEWRVMDRLGSRDRAGIRRAMKKYKVDNIDDLVKVLEHHKPKRKTKHRLRLAIGRVVSGYKYNPHKKDYKQAFKKKSIEQIEIENRLKDIKKLYDG